jgi:hypothetical protein
MAACPGGVHPSVRLAAGSLVAAGAAGMAVGDRRCSAADSGLAADDAANPARPHLPQHGLPISRRGRQPLRRDGQPYGGATNPYPGPGGQYHAKFNLTGSDLSYPGTDTVMQLASTGCSTRTANIDRSKATDAMTVHFLFPDRNAWLGGRRTVSCMVVDPAGDINYSLLK